MQSMLNLMSVKDKDCLIKKPIPAFTQPMLAYLTHHYFSDQDWIFERKFDGERCLAFIKKHKVTLKSRNDKILNGTYPELVEAFEKQKLPDMIVDGEIVAFEGKQTSFAKLQARFGITDPQKAEKTGIKVFLYLFDILYYDGYDLTHLPLIVRKNLLKKVILFKNSIRYTIHRNTEGILAHKRACKLGWEGVIAKRRTSIYLHKRSQDWLKFKCINEQELVIGGYTEPQGARIGFGALLLGYYKNNKFYYAGKVGTGFNETILADLYKKMHAKETDKNPFVNFDDSLRGVHWIRPTIVCQVGFTEWTTDNKLRHPRYLGLRLDKSAKEVRQEKA